MAHLKRLLAEFQANDPLLSAKITGLHQYLEVAKLDAVNLDNNTMVEDLDVELKIVSQAMSF